MLGRAAMAGVLLALLAPIADAHKLNVSYLELREDGRRLHAKFDVDPHDTPLFGRLDADADGVVTASELTPHRAALLALVVGRLEAVTPGGRCQLEGMPRDEYALELSMWHVEASWLCHGDASQAAISIGYLDAMPREHQAFARVIDSDRRMRQLMLRRGETRVRAHERAWWREAGEFLASGVEHILSGFDHLAFILAVLLSATSLRRAIVALTAFTVAHSATLALAALQLVTLPSRLVEVTIATSISFVALQNLWRQRRGGQEGGELGGRIAVVFAFGLVHGLGFANVLDQAQLSTAMTVVALASFNVGVELGQVGVVALVLPLLLALRRRRREAWLQLAPALSIALALAGAFWAVERVVAS